MFIVTYTHTQLSLLSYDLGKLLSLSQMNQLTRLDLTFLNLR